MPLPETGQMSMLSWLEFTLIEERRALESALAVRHAALLREISPYLQGIDWSKAFDTQEIPGLAYRWRHVRDRGPPSHNVADNATGQHVWSTGGHDTESMILDGKKASLTTPWWRYIRDAASHSTTPSHNAAGKDMDQRVWSTENPDTESTIVDVDTTSMARLNCHETLPSRQPSHDLEASHRNSSSSQGRDRERRCAVFSGRGRLSASSEESLSGIAALRAGNTVNDSFARLRRFTRGPAFESGFALLILINTLMMAMESQCTGIDSGWKIGYPGSSSQASETCPGDRKSVV